MNVDTPVRDASSETRRPTLIIYGRRECHLCEVAKEVVATVRQRVAFDVEERDVDADPTWKAAYGDEVPVGFVGNRKVFKYRVDAARLELALSSGRRREDAVDRAPHD